MAARPMIPTRLLFRTPAQCRPCVSTQPVPAPEPCGSRTHGESWTTSRVTMACSVTGYSTPACSFAVVAQPTNEYGMSPRHCAAVNGGAGGGFSGMASVVGWVSDGRHRPYRGHKPVDHEPITAVLLRRGQAVRSARIVQMPDDDDRDRRSTRIRTRQQGLVQLDGYERRQVRAGCGDVGVVVDDLQDRLGPFGDPPLAIVTSDFEFAGIGDADGHECGQERLVQ